MNLGNFTEEILEKEQKANALRSDLFQPDQAIFLNKLFYIKTTIKESGVDKFSYLRLAE
jgi:hypothetical protein